MRRREMMIQETEEIDTQPVITDTYAGINTSGAVVSYGTKGYAVTDYYEIKSSGAINFSPAFTYVSGTNTGNKVGIYNTDKTPKTYKSYTNRSTRFTGVEGGTLARFLLTMGEEDNSYAYEETTGRVLYAGINTPYYGKRYV